MRCEARFPVTRAAATMIATDRASIAGRARRCGRWCQGDPPSCGDLLHSGARQIATTNGLGLGSGRASRSALDIPDDPEFFEHEEHEIHDVHLIPPVEPVMGIARI